MSLVVCVVLAALAVGWLRGGSLARLGALQVRSPLLVAGAVAAQVGGVLLGGAAWPAGLALSAVLLAAWLHRNRALRGTGLVAAGLLANAVVVAANGAMPVSPQAAGQAGVSLAPLLDGRDPRHELQGPGTRLRGLGDVVPVPLPLRPEVVSPGDVLVAAGLGQLLVTTLGGGGLGRTTGGGRRARTAHR